MVHGFGCARFPNINALCVSFGIILALTQFGVDIVGFVCDIIETAVSARAVVLKFLRQIR